MKPKILIIIFVLTLVLDFTGIGSTTNLKEETMANHEKIQIATFAGGCFWCVESAFQDKKGIMDVVSGYMGGHLKDPTYEQVSSGSSGHAEVVRITYNPKIISYSELLKIFFQQIDPTDAAGSFVDRGSQYRSAVFYHSQDQRVLADGIIDHINGAGILDAPVATQVIKAEIFYPAESYHQDYYKKNPIQYKFYRYGSGRDKFIKNFWEKGNKEIFDTFPQDISVNKAYPMPTDAQLKKQLTPIQYKVTRENGTEPAFNNEYWDNKKPGIYVDIISGKPLFSSLDKFDSGTGWPSFTKPLDKTEVVEKEDNSFFMKRVEIRSKTSDSHLGHVFNDGPAPGRLRYCINSAALLFIPKKDLKSKGYQGLAGQFD